MSLLINLFDSNFSFDIGSVAGKPPQEIEYMRGEMDWDGITVFTDGWILRSEVDVVRSRYKVGWLHEGEELKPEVYRMSWDVRHKFDFIMTYYTPLLEQDPQKYKPIIRGGIWTPKTQWGLHPKSKTVSMILSNKQQLSGHQLRHKTASRFDGIDLYGAKGDSIGTDKARALRDYQFSVIIEASRQENFFSEHLLDCIVFGTIPIYWGCPNIGKFFDTEGFIQFEKLNELESILHGLSPELYQEKLSIARRNLKRAKQYEITDDWIARNVFAPWLRERVA